MKKILSFLYNLKYTPPTFYEKGKGNVIRYCDGRLIQGKDNRIIVKDNCVLDCCKFVVKGNKNTIIIGNNVRLSGMSFVIEDDDNTIIVGDNTTIGKRTELAALEGSRIIIGKDCMLSHDILVRTSDSHSIVDDNGNRINQAKSIVIDDHCWIGLQCLVLKGASLGKNSILGAKSILTKAYTKSGLIIAGTPAKVIRENVNWDRKRI